MPFGNERLTPRQAAAKERRESMNRRRHEISQKIRKQKKSEYLARKRKLPISDGAAAGGSGATPLDIVDCVNRINALIESPTLDTLRALEESLASSASLLSSMATSENPLVILQQDQVDQASSLMRQLKEILQSTFTSRDVIAATLQILVHLTAIAVPSSLQQAQEESYYGNLAVGWCTVLSRDFDLVKSLNHYIPHWETAALIIGNLAGEHSQEVRRVLHQAIPSLVQALDRPADNPQQQPSVGATWAVSNMIRNDTVSLASDYFNDQAISPSLLERLLLCPVSKVSTQAAFMVAALSGREPDTVDRLVKGSPSLLPNMLRLMGQETVSHNSDNAEEASILFLEERRLALIQTFGNIASYEEYCPALLSSSLQLALLVTELLRTIQKGGPMLQQLTWLAGSLLCDAGVENHPSTTVAAPLLIPVLSDKLASSHTTTTLSLDDCRELANALWNAFSPPPTSLNNQSFVPLEYMEHSLQPMIQVLVDMCKTTVDMDAVVAALNVINLLLRRLPSLKVTLEEFDISLALEQICDTCPEHVGEIAANLLDDFFEGENDHNNEDDQAMDFGNLGFQFPQPGSNAVGVDPRGNVISSRSPATGMGRGRGAVLPSWMPMN